MTLPAYIYKKKIIKFIAEYSWAVALGALFAEYGWHPWDSWQYWIWFIIFSIIICMRDLLHSSLDTK